MHDPLPNDPKFFPRYKTLSSIIGVAQVIYYSIQEISGSGKGTSLPTTFELLKTPGVFY